MVDSACESATLFDESCATFWVILGWLCYCRRKSAINSNLLGIAKSVGPDEADSLTALFLARKDGVNLQLKHMREVKPVTDLLNRAFELAYFILGDRSASIYVAMAAMDKLKAASANQVRRLYYTPTGRSDYPASRTKVNLSEPHLLQRLVYIESELFERLIEGQRRSIHQDDLIIRYIKHLIRITTKHNSFYVTLGLCRLLYNYSTADTSEIYNLVLQDPERIRDDYYYRSRKKGLMQQIKDRFGNLIRTQQGLRREERFQSQEDSQGYAGLVKECLIRFTPWHSACVLPAELDPNRNVIAQLLFAGADPDEEHQIELNRIHTLIHPDCLKRLTTALRLDLPEQRLQLPSFFVSSQGTRPPEDRFNPTELTDGELEAITRYLDKNAGNRKQFSQTQLSLLIDGKRLADFELQPLRPVVFDLGAATELVEIRSGSIESEEDTPLAVSILDHDRLGILPVELSVALGRKRSLSLEVLPVGDDADTISGARLRICESQPATAGAILSLPFKIKLWSGQLIDLRQAVLRPALSMLFVAVCVIGLWVYFHSRRVVDNPTPVAKLQDDHGPASLPSPPRATIAPPQAPAAVPPRLNRAIGKHAMSRNIHDETEIARVRGVNPRVAAARLRAIKRVYVDPLGDDLFSQQLRETLMQQLQTSNRFVVVTNRDDADAVFKGSVGQASQRGVNSSAVLELVNAGGEVVWSSAVVKGKQDDPAEASAEIVRVLLRDTRRLERRR